MLDIWLSIFFYHEMNLESYNSNEMFFDHLLKGDVVYEFERQTQTVWH